VALALHEGSAIWHRQERDRQQIPSSVSPNKAALPAVIDQMLICTACRRCGTSSACDLVSQRFFDTFLPLRQKFSERT